MAVLHDLLLVPRGRDQVPDEQVQAVEERDRQEVADHRQGEADYNIKVNPVKQIGYKLLIIDTYTDG